MKHEFPAIDTSVVEARVRGSLQSIFAQGESDSPTVSDLTQLGMRVHEFTATPVDDRSPDFAVKLCETLPLQLFSVNSYLQLCAKLEATAQDDPLEVSAVRARVSELVSIGSNLSVLYVQRALHNMHLLDDNSNSSFTAILEGADTIPLDVRERIRASIALGSDDTFMQASDDIWQRKKQQQVEIASRPEFADIEEVLRQDSRAIVTEQNGNDGGEKKTFIDVIEQYIFRYSWVLDTFTPYMRERTMEIARTQLKFAALLYDNFRDNPSLSRQFEAFAFLVDLSGEFTDEHSMWVEYRKQLAQLTVPEVAKVFAPEKPNTTEITRLWDQLPAVSSKTFKEIVKTQFDETRKRIVKGDPAVELIGCPDGSLNNTLRLLWSLGQGNPAEHEAIASLLEHSRRLDPAHIYDETVRGVLLAARWLDRNIDALNHNRPTWHSIPERSFVRSAAANLDSARQKAGATASL